MSEPEHTPYRVLARKYRPHTFDELIGQEPMVQTLTNAFKLNRIAQAYMLTGVRGVGKTTTARILARALNYSLAAQNDQPAIDTPTINMPKLGEHCAAIIESRHVDVIEMDAASHTSINDIREIIEAARYKPAMARYKIYIIDEVHMLSQAAFNGLLKTLEEPPAHVKFIFATTEIRKVPVTVLSRCQRFDLRRIEADTMIGFLDKISKTENVKISMDALRQIARASEGSVRDALSILDQAIAYQATETSDAIDKTNLSEMLGWADHTKIVDLFKQVMMAEIASALDTFHEIHSHGADPSLILSDLAEFIHHVTRLKIDPNQLDQGLLSPQEREHGLEFAAKLSIRVLSMAWQILLKGIQEVDQSSKPAAAADMVLIRLAFAADLPTPDEIIKQIKTDDKTDDSGHSKPQASETPQQQPNHKVSNSAASNRATSYPDQSGAFVLNTLQDVANLALEKRALPLKFFIERHLRLISFETNRIEVALNDDAPANMTGELSQKLTEWTGSRWIVTITRDEGAPTLYEQNQNERDVAFQRVAKNPIVAAALEAFPGAKILDIIDQNKEPETASKREQNRSFS